MVLKLFSLGISLIEFTLRTSHITRIFNEVSTFNMNEKHEMETRTLLEI